MVSFAKNARSNEEWLADLQASGARREAALEELRDYLLRAVLVYLTRHRSDLSGFDYDELQQLAEDWAQQAVIQVLDKLDTFRGDSKFTTWAYRVAINLAAGELRRKRWENVSLEGLTDDGNADLRLSHDASSPTPEAQFARRQVWDTIRSVIENELTERQRTALMRVVFDGAPVEVVAQQLDTNRNNIYKIIHDARKKLKRELELRDWSADDVLRAFESEGGEP
jgi:RNA polymerase sigma-70 factor (ECF subfamily)